MFDRTRLINLEKSFKSQMINNWQSQYKNLLNQKINNFLDTFKPYFQLKKQKYSFGFIRKDIDVLIDIPIKLNQLKESLLLDEYKDKCDEILYLLNTYIFDLILYEIKDNLFSIQKHIQQRRIEKIKKWQEKRNKKFNKKSKNLYGFFHTAGIISLTADETPHNIEKFCQFNILFNTQQYKQKMLDFIWNYFETINYIIKYKFPKNAKKNQKEELLKKSFIYNKFTSIFQKIYIINQNSNYKLKNLIESLNIDLYLNYKNIFTIDNYLTSYLFDSYIFDKKTAKKFLQYAKFIAPTIKIINNHLVIYPINFEFFKQYYDKINFIKLFNDSYDFKYNNLIANINKQSANLHKNIYIDSQFLIDCINFLGIDKFVQYLKKEDQHKYIDYSKIYLYGKALESDIIINRKLIKPKKGFTMNQLLEMNTINTKTEKEQITLLFKKCGIN